MTKDQKDNVETFRVALKRFRRKITYSAPFLAIVALVAFLLFWLFRRTLRVEVIHHPEFVALDRNKVCYGFWHGRQFLLVPTFGDSHAAIMTDISWAGSIQARILSWFGYKTVRGSSKRQGAQALLEMKKTLLEGSACAFALDGPSGPIHRSKPGILLLAKKVGYPIVPLTASANRFWILRNTWCRYIVPFPFSKCVVGVGRPFFVDSTHFEHEANRLDRHVTEWTEEMDRRAGVVPARFFDSVDRAIK